MYVGGVEISFLTNGLKISKMWMSVVVLVVSWFSPIPLLFLRLRSLQCCSSSFLVKFPAEFCLYVTITSALVNVSLYGCMNTDGAQYFYSKIVPHCSGCIELVEAI